MATYSPNTVTRLYESPAKYFANYGKPRSREYFTGTSIRVSQQLDQPLRVAFTRTLLSFTKVFLKLPT